MKPIDRMVAEGLAALIVNRKFSAVDASAIMETFAEIVATVTRAKKLEARVKQLERQMKSAQSKKAPIVNLREAG